MILISLVWNLIDLSSTSLSNHFRERGELYQEVGSFVYRKYAHNYSKYC